MIENSTNTETGSKLSFPGKIAVITSPPSISEDDFYSADRLIEKYGAGKIIHVTWPENYMTEQYKMIEIASKLALDRDIKAVIINQTVEGSNKIVDKIKETRDDIFFVYCNPSENIPDSAARANLILGNNFPIMGSAMVRQAKKQGAKTFVHYSFPRHMVISFSAKRHDKIQETCAAEGLQFVDATAPDPAGEVNLSSVQQFIFEDVPKQVAKYGEDTAFFSTNCHMQASLIKAVIDCHAIYPQPCCPSPLHGFPEALGIETDKGHADLRHFISEACRIAEEKNMSDRLSTWPVSSAMMFTNAGAEYVIKWIKGEVQKTGIDRVVLEECMNSFIQEVIGEVSNVYINAYSEEGKIYDNHFLVLMSYLDF